MLDQTWDLWHEGHTISYTYPIRFQIEASVELQTTLLKCESSELKIG